MTTPDTSHGASSFTADQLRELERSRTQSLVERDMALSSALHAAEYQLITPAGKTLTKQSYLDAIETGRLRYVSWDAGPMAVRLSPRMAIVRYQARLGFASGTVVSCWHTDSWELRDGRWLAVWSQATAINEAT